MNGILVAKGRHCGYLNSFPDRVPLLRFRLNELWIFITVEDAKMHTFAQKYTQIIRNINNSCDIEQMKQSPIVRLHIFNCIRRGTNFHKYSPSISEVDFHILGGETRVFPPKLTFDVIVSYVSLRARRASPWNATSDRVLQAHAPIVYRATRWKHWQATSFFISEK